tara:strand:- start:2550 stop:3191 length:642 start_codon:yes stop_codon:yes gene_type:complete
VKLNLQKFKNLARTTIIDLWEYVIPIWKISGLFKSIKTKKDIENFIQERSAHVTQTTLYGYLKTRIGVKYIAMMEDDRFLESINIAKWNIYTVALADCTFYVFSYLISEKNLKDNNCKEVFLKILERERKNGLSEEIYNNGKSNFLKRFGNINFNNYYINDPFKESGEALYYWSPIADELKTLDKKIVLNSISLKWGLMKDELKKRTKDFNFN